LIIEVFILREKLILEPVVAAVPVALLMEVFQMAIVVVEVVLAVVAVEVALGQCQIPTKLV